MEREQRLKYVMISLLLPGRSPQFAAVQRGCNITVGGEEVLGRLKVVSQVGGDYRLVPFYPSPGPFGICSLPAFTS